MSMLAGGQDVKYRSVTVRVIKCSAGIHCWYRPLIGKELQVTKVCWYQDGEPDGFHYEMQRTPDGGHNGFLNKDDVEEL